MSRIISFAAVLGYIYTAAASPARVPYEGADLPELIPKQDGHGDKEVEYVFTPLDTEEVMHLTTLKDTKRELNTIALQRKHTAAKKKDLIVSKGKGKGKGKRHHSIADEPQAQIDELKKPTKPAHRAIHRPQKTHVMPRPKDDIVVQNAKAQMTKAERDAEIADRYGDMNKIHTQNLIEKKHRHDHHTSVWHSAEKAFSSAKASVKVFSAKVSSFIPASLIPSWNSGNKKVDEESPIGQTCFFLLPLLCCFAFYGWRRAKKASSAPGSPQSLSPRATLV